ncbi:hypothetical protein IHE49_14345 [Rhodanobacter sp. 7MK24]|uniref:hypothetical protein n=1 Tax=Rhodanobacter sp. 7MK24 TaxID=2775922 RepID=UPI001782B424|nr:hypothetical protein [Rhodanobacter sp. 7MK24]MBD8881662.1 hypothetical protein [Rhodanobacter sp. 7MK24]
MHTISLRLTVCALAFGLLVAAPLGAVSAQDAPPSASDAPAAPHRLPDPQKQAHRLAHKLGLDADQQSKLAAIFGNRQQQVAAVRADNTLSMRDRRTKLLAIHQDSESQIKALLSPTQQQQYAQLQQAMKAHREAQQESNQAAPESH